MKLKQYYIEFGKGQIYKGERPDDGNGLETYGRSTALAVARLIKKGDLSGALMAANNGIERAVQ